MVRPRRAIGSYKRPRKSVLFVKFEIILPLLCYLLDPTTNNYISVRRSMTNKTLWIDSRICPMTPLVTVGKV